MKNLLSRFIKLLCVHLAIILMLNSVEITMVGGFMEMLAEMTGLAYAEPVDDQEMLMYFLGQDDRLIHVNHDYGFRENRAWVSDGRNAYLIDVNGYIIYEVPESVSVDDQYGIVHNLNRFYPVRNGVTYYTSVGGSLNYDGDTSVIIDEDGHEIARFVGKHGEECYIAGRTDDRFLLVCYTRNAVYFVPLGLDGQPVDVPRLVIGGHEDDVVDTGGPLLDDLGDGIFCGTLYKEASEFDIDSSRVSFFYNLNNNTIQRMDSYDLFAQGNQFYDGTVIVNNYLVTLDDLQEERIHLVLPEANLLQEGRLLMTDAYYGNVQTEYNQYYSISGEEITFPKHLNGSVYYISKDGYIVFLEQEYCELSLMNPSNEFLYEQVPLPSNTFLVSICENGYVLCEQYDGSSYEVLIDRAGKTHSLDEDLSSLPGLSDISGGCFGCGYLIESEKYISKDASGDNLVIRSLDGAHIVTSMRRTADTKKLDDIVSLTPQPDFSNAVAIGDYHTATAAGNDNIYANENKSVSIPLEDDSGVILVDSFWGNDDVNILDEDGVRVYFRANDGRCALVYENNNLSNKQVRICNAYLTYNGIYLGNLQSTASDLVMDAFYPLTSGDTKVFDEISNNWDFMVLMGSYSAVLAELPLQEVTVNFDMQIGKSADYEHYSCVIRSRDYSPMLMEDLYGESLSICEYNGIPAYQAYALQGANEPTYIIKNLSDEWMIDVAVFISNSSIWCINGEHYGGWFKLTFPPQSAIIVTLPYTLKSIYDYLEIPNDTPVSIGLQVTAPTEGPDGDQVIIDLGQVTNE